MAHSRKDNSTPGTPGTPGTPEPILVSDGESATEAVHDTVVEMGPWMVSLMAHLGVIILALFLVWSTMVDRPEEPVGPVSVEMTRPSNDKPLETSDNPELTNKQSQRNPKTEHVAVDTPDIQTVRSVLPDLIGPGPSGQIGDFIRQRPTSGDDGLFKDPGKTPPGGEPAKRIVFVIDASGSVIDGFDFVINELRSTIHKLDDKQSFSVIFFQHGFAIEAAAKGSRGMHEATWDRKVAVCDWITTSTGHITPSGSSDPRPALKRAFAYKPDLVYILSDNITGRGVYQLDRDDLLKDIKAMNTIRGRSAQPRATIHTIQFLYPDPLGTLEAISDETKGTHRFVREADLVGPRPRNVGPGA